MIVKKIKTLCVERDITVAWLERYLGLSNGTISKWRVSTPRVDTLRRVADFFGVTIDELIREEA